MHIHMCIHIYIHMFICRSSYILQYMYRYMYRNTGIYICIYSSYNPYIRVLTMPCPGLKEDPGLQHLRSDHGVAVLSRPKHGLTAATAYVHIYIYIYVYLHV